MFNIPTFSFRQPVVRLRVDDPYAETRREMRRLAFPVQSGQTVAVTASSRGIADLLPVTRAVVDHFKELGLVPGVVPAMGSHAGGTAESQRKLLIDAGLTETVLGCPILSTTETVRLSELAVQTNSGTISCPVHFDRFAFEADHVFLVNRVKSHTRFSGPIESGLLKMLMIGLGNPEGASAYHRAVSDDRFSVVIRQVADFLCKKISVLGGLGIVENGEGKTGLLRAAGISDLVAEEEKMLVTAKNWTPRLPFDDLDLLFVRKIGKNISGTGMDSNVIGRKHDDHKAVTAEEPNIRCIAVCGLTEETGGNANGIGMAEFCLGSVLRKIDWRKTRFNAMTANHVSAAMVPLDFETETEIIEAAWLTLGRPDPAAMRIAWIEDTLHLEEITAGESLRAEIVARGLDIL